MSNVTIKYDGRAIGAKDAFTAEFGNTAAISDSAEVLERDGVAFANYGNPLETYSVALDGRDATLPPTVSDNVGVKSEQLSGADGVFAVPPTLTLSASELFASQGITLRFDDSHDIYATEVNIKWYRDDTLLETADFEPDAPFFICFKAVELFNKIVITFGKINLPYNRLTLRAVDFGAIVEFDGGEIVNVSVTQQVDPLSAEITIDTVDFNIRANKNVDYLFEKSQPFTVLFRGELIATTFVSEVRQTGYRRWSIKSEGYISFLESVDFPGGMYSGQDVAELIADIFATARVPYSLADDFEGMTVSGYIPYTTCRAALAQVAFAIGATVSAAYNDKVRIFKLSETASQSIPLSRIMQGQSTSDNARVTAVEVYAHSYSQGTETVRLYTADDGIGNGIEVRFDEPMHSLTISNGTIVKSGANFAIINAASGCTLTGKKYIHGMVAKRKANPLVLANDLENVVTVKDATLVSVANVDTVLEKCYNYYTGRKKATFQIVEGRHSTDTGMVTDQAVKVGERIGYATENSGERSGVVVRQSYSLNGGILLKNTEVV